MLCLNYPRTWIKSTGDYWQNCIASRFICQPIPNRRHAGSLTQSVKMSRHQALNKRKDGHQNLLTLLALDGQKIWCWWSFKGKYDCMFGCVWNGTAWSCIVVAHDANQTLSFLLLPDINTAGLMKSLHRGWCLWSSDH